MRRQVLLLVVIAAIVGFGIGFNVAGRANKSVYLSDATASSSPSDQTVASASSSPSGGGFSGGSSNSSSSPSPSVNPLANPSLNPFNYTPLPANQGPENDIAESQPLTASRNTVQIDGWVTFTTTIKNQASYTRTLYNLCFESTDGNFGCIFNITLAPGQTYTFNNVGSWVHSGEKQIWVTWSPDNVNYFTPVNANTVTVDVLG